MGRIIATIARDDAGLACELVRTARDPVFVADVDSHDHLEQKGATVVRVPLSLVLRHGLSYARNRLLSHVPANVEWVHWVELDERPPQETATPKRGWLGTVRVARRREVRVHRNWNAARFLGLVHESLVVTDARAVEDLPITHRRVRRDRPAWDGLRAWLWWRALLDPHVQQGTDPRRFEDLDGEELRRLRDLARSFERTHRGDLPFALDFAIPKHVVWSEAKAQRRLKNVTAIVPCRGRLHHVKETLPRLIAATDVVFVDYSCPDRSGAYVEKHFPEVHVVEVPNETRFNKARALNAGLRAAKTDYVAIVDADMFVSPRFAEAAGALIKPKRIVARAEEWTGTGFMIAPRQEVLAAGGYDERMEGWGYEDDDIRRRLVARGLEVARLPHGAIRVVRHSTRERSTEDLFLSSMKNQALVWEHRWRPEWLEPRWIPRRFMVSVAGIGLGDAIKSAHYVLHLRRTLGLDVSLYPLVHEEREETEPERIARSATDIAIMGLYDALSPRDLAYLDGRVIFDQEARVRELLALLDDDTPLPITKTRDPAIPMIRLPPFPWMFPYARAKIRWKPWTRGLRKKICVQLDGRANAAAKNPPQRDLKRLLGFLPGFEVVQLGRDRSLAACARELASSDLFFGVDSGMLHLCHSVGTPAFVVGYTQDPWIAFAWHGDKSVISCAGTDELIANVRVFLGV